MPDKSPAATAVRQWTSRDGPSRPWLCKEAARVAQTTQSVSFSASEFAEDTELERFVLKLLGAHHIRVAEPSATHDMRGRVGGVGGNIYVKVGAAVAGGAAREELVRSLRPLVFGAAYKVLDLLVEHVLRADGAGPGRLTFQRKSAILARRPSQLPVPLDSHPDLWDRLAEIYKALQEARHAVTHRRAQATAEGDLEIYDDRRQISDTVASHEISCFAAAVHAMAELLIDGQTDARRFNIVAFYLNVLQPRHGLAFLIATDPNAGRRLLIMDLVALPDGKLRFDTSVAKEFVAGQVPSVWDLELHGDERVFVGYWEAVRYHEGPVDFHPALPPPWLSEEVPATSS
jgi:hypothetical protein